MSLADVGAVGLLLAAFAGGVLGASVGALQSFVITGALVLFGETAHLLRANLGGTVGAAPITDTLAFGPFGPHVAFGGGAAALAYAVRRGYVDGEGFDYHPAKEVTRGLGSRWDVLLVGGAFGVVGYWVATVSGALAAPWDPVAFGVVVSALAHRAVFGYAVVGAPRSLGDVFDMTPFERGERREAVSDGGSATAGGSATPAGGSAEERTDGGTTTRYVVEPWLPYQYRWSDVSVLGVGVGILAAYAAYVTGSAFFAFGVSVVSIGFLIAGVAEVPVTHHVSLPASTVVIAMVPGAGARVAPAAVTGAVPIETALLAGAVAGLAGALAGELTQRVFLAHAETHLDPPAASIVVTSLCIAVAATVGVLPGSAWVPVP